MVGQVGLEPTMPLAPDLQSGGVTNFPTDPDFCFPIFATTEKPEGF